MDDDDEFGDLYTDVLRPQSSPFPSSSSAAAVPPPLLSSSAAAIPFPDPLPTPSGDTIQPSQSPPPPAKSQPPATAAAAAAADDDDGDDDWLLGRTSPAIEPPVNWDDDDDDNFTVKPSHKGELRVLDADLDVEEAGVSPIPAGDGGGNKGEGFEAREVDRDLDQAPVIPGLSAAPPLVEPKDDDAKPPISEDWDSDSEDDLQIVLNDEDHRPLGIERDEGAGVEDADGDDGEEDLVIVTDGDQLHHLPEMEEQEWGEEGTQAGADGERKDSGELVKGAGPSVSAPAARIGYSNHGFHAQHHSTFKYVRLGVAPISVGPTGGALGTSGQLRPPIPPGPFAGRGRGDWRPTGGRGIIGQKAFHSGYTFGWNSSSARGFGTGLDFTLPSHKTVFDVDIDGFEEKPWKYPGADISDFFNFGLDEEKWRDYCKQLDQLRLESTMQSRIHVYESGRSDPVHDPDLPPELAAAAGHHDISVDNGLHSKADSTQLDFSGQGRGPTSMRPPFPPGRAIQVEGGYGERLPSIDRPQRMRESDAVIEIVLQDSTEESTVHNGEQSEKDSRGERGKDVEVYDNETNTAPKNTGHFVGAFSDRKRDPPSYKTKSPLEDGLFDTNHGGRSSRQTSRGRHSSASAETSNDISRQPSKSKRHDNHQKNKELVEGTEINSASEVSPTVPVEDAKESSIEDRFDENDGKLALADSLEVEAEDASSDLHMVNETHGDDNLDCSGKKQKISSLVEQPAVYDNGDDTLHSDNSREKSGTSKENPKHPEHGEDVMQESDQKSHHEGEEHNPRRKDGYHRDAPAQIDRSRVATKGREDLNHPYSHKEQSNTSRASRDRSFERLKETDNWQRREDGVHGRRNKDEDTRLELSAEASARHRSKVRPSDRNEKGNDLRPRKLLDDGGSRGSRYRDRNDGAMTRHEGSDDSHLKRKRDDDNTRRGKPEMEDSLHIHSPRDDSGRRKEREDNARTKDKIENHYHSKHKDDNLHLKEKEGRQWPKQAHENRLMQRGREEGRGAVRSGRVADNKPLTGSGRNKDDLRPEDKERRRQNEHLKRDRDKEENVTQNKGYGNLHQRDKQLKNDLRNSRQERPSSHGDRPSWMSDIHRTTRDRHKDNPRKGRGYEPTELNAREPAKRRHEEHDFRQIDKVDMKGTNEQDSSNVSPVTSSRKGHNQMNDQPNMSQATHRLKNGDEDPASDDNQEDSRKGRSKMERWTSHKERDYTTVDTTTKAFSTSIGAKTGASGAGAAPADDLGKQETNADPKGADTGQISDKMMEERDRHLDTVERLKRRSERFKLPMLGEKEAALSKRAENELQLPQNEAVVDTEVKAERPARKRRWTGS